MNTNLPRNEPTKEELPLDRAQHFLRLLWRVNHVIEARSKQMSVNLGITFQQRTLLRLAGRFPGITAGRLADTLHVDPGTISAALGRLEGRGLLERTQDPHDRRRVRLWLTKKGHALNVPTSGTVESAVEKMISIVSANDLAIAESVLLALVGAVDDLPMARYEGETE